MNIADDKITIKKENRVNKREIAYKIRYENKASRRIDKKPNAISAN